MLRRCRKHAQQAFWGRSMLSRFGWLLVMLITIGLLVLNSISITFPWWGIDFTGDGCSEKFYVLWLKWGMCLTNSPQQLDIEDCFAFDDSEDWETVDQSSGKDTHRARTVIYPFVYSMSILGVGILGIQLIISFVQWRRMSYSMIPQRVVLLITFIWMILIYATQVLGADTSITRASTWQYSSDCTSHVSYPGVGYVSVNLIGIVTVLALYMLINFPKLLRCCHVTRSDQNREDSNDIQTTYSPDNMQQTAMGDRVPVGKEINAPPGDDSSICDKPNPNARQTDFTFGSNVTITYPEVEKTDVKHSVSQVV